MADVLIVDDDRAIRGVLRAILEGADYTVDEACNGDAALARLQTACTATQPQVILLDLEMPGLDGVQTLEALARPPLAALCLQVIVVTASPRPLPPAFAYLPILRKPFDLDDLLTYVEAALRSHQFSVCYQLAGGQHAQP